MSKWMFPRSREAQILYGALRMSSRFPLLIFSSKKGGYAGMEMYFRSKSSLRCGSLLFVYSKKHVVPLSEVGFDWCSWA